MNAADFRVHVEPSRDPLGTRPLRRLAACLALGAAVLGLSGCTAFMDMTISADGTYDVVVEMRDTTGAVFAADPDCSPYTDPAVIGAPEGTEVHAEELTGGGGSGCLVTIAGVDVPDVSTTSATQTPQASAGTGQTASSPLVVRDGDLYLVTLPPLMADGGSAAGAADPAGTGGPGTLNDLTEARVSVSFPGAVVDDGGGQVSGTTVTWTDADVIAEGVSASGHATDGEGRSAWQAAGPWAAGALVAAVAVLGVVAARRRWRSRR